MNVVVYTFLKNIELHKKYMTSVILKRGAIRKKEATDKLLILVFTTREGKVYFVQNEKISANLN